jgi:hypothetical protein
MWLITGYHGSAGDWWLLATDRIAAAMTTLAEQGQEGGADVPQVGSSTACYTWPPRYSPASGLGLAVATKVAQNFLMEPGAKRSVIVKVLNG